MKNTTDPRAALEAVSTEQCNIYTNVSALRNLVDEFTASLLIRAQNANAAGNDRWNAGNALNNLLPALDERLAPALSALGFLEASAEYREAVATIEPIKAAIVELEKQEQAARERVAKEAHEAKERLDALLVKAQSTPEVLAAKKAVEDAARKVSLVAK